MFNFVTLMIIIFGAINWFCIGVFQFDLIAGIFGTQSHFFSRFIYTVIGLAGFWFLAITLIKRGKLALLPPKKKKDKNKKGNEIQESITSESTAITETSDNNELNAENTNIAQSTEGTQQQGFIIQPITTTMPPLNSTQVTTPIQAQTPQAQVQTSNLAQTTSSATTQASIPQSNITPTNKTDLQDTSPTITLHPTNQDNQQKAKVNIEVSLPSAETTGEEQKAKKSRKTKTKKPLD